MTKRSRNPQRSPITFVMTCEHGGNHIPREYQALFKVHKALLDSHRGWDPGALGMARQFARTLDAPLIASTVSRLLVELNRSPGHPAMFSIITRPLDAGTKARIRAHYYDPHRHRVLRACQDAITDGNRIIHIGVHTFTPELDGEVRNAEIGLLYDPRRPLEQAYCCGWCAFLRESILNQGLPLRVRRNYPYRGIADGLPTFLRKCFSPDTYLGLELEVNQRLFLNPEEKSLAAQAVTILIETCRQAAATIA